MRFRFSNFIVWLHKMKQLLIFWQCLHVIIYSPAIQQIQVPEQIYNEQIYPDIAST